MRRIAIIGAGQGGLTLALALKKLGYATTLFSNRTAEQIKNGRILSSQAMFDQALTIERTLGLNYWEQQCVWKKHVDFSIAAPGETKKMIHWKGKTQKPFQSIDQRLKFSSLLDKYEGIGGKLVIQDVGLQDLDKIAQQNELTLVAGGKGEISQAFARDNTRSIFDKPQRALAAFYFHGTENHAIENGVSANLIPGIGEFFHFPCLSLNGPCHTILFEGIPGGPFDSFSGINNPKDQLEHAQKLLKEFVPWEAEKCQNIELVDSQATLIGRFTPTVRQPVTMMPCGKPIFAMADSVVLNDPIAGQGANNATKCAEIYLQGIQEQGEKEFDEKWMRETFEKFWKRSARLSTQFSNMLLCPPPAHVVEFLAAGMSQKNVADQFSHGFENPNSLFPWIMNPEETKMRLGELESRQNIIME